MKSIIIVTVVTGIVSIGIYKGIRKVLYKKDVTNKASFARLIKYVLVFINGMIFYTFHNFYYNTAINY